MASGIQFHYLNPLSILLALLCTIGIIEDRKSVVSFPVQKHINFKQSLLNSSFLFEWWTCLQH